MTMHQPEAHAERVPVDFQALLNTHLNREAVRERLTQLLGVPSDITSEHLLAGQTQPAPNATATPSATLMLAQHRLTQPDSLYALEHWQKEFSQAATGLDTLQVTSRTAPMVLTRPTVDLVGDKL
jgi:hypothetical protein